MQQEMRNRVTLVKAIPGKHRVTEYKCESRYTKEKLGAFLFYLLIPIKRKFYLDAYLSQITFANLLKSV